MQADMKLPPGAQLADDGSDLKLPPGASLVSDESSSSVDFSAPKDNKEGLYRMRTPGGEEKKVPHSKVMDAYKAGYLIHPDDRDTYGKNREFEFKQQGKKFNPDLDMPLAYDVVEASPKAGSLPWVKEMAQRAREKTLSLLPVAGGVAGGLAVGGPGLVSGPADIAAAAGGAAAGGAIGEGVRQAAEEKIHPYDHRMTPKEAATGIVEQGAMQGVNEATGRVAGKVLAPAEKYFANAASEARRTGVRLLPSEAAGKAPSYVEKLAKGHVFTSGTMEKFRAAQNAETQSAVQRIADKISRFNGSSEDLGQLVQSGIDSHMENFRKIQNKLYADIRTRVNEHVVQVPVVKQVPTGYMLAGGVPETRPVTVMQDRVIDDVMPSTVALKKFAKDELEKLDRVSDVLDPNLLSQSRAMLEHLSESPDNVTFNAMFNARSDALAKAREFDQAMAGKQAGLAKKMAGLFDEAMVDGASKSKIPDLVDQVREANAFTANEHKMFEQALVDKIVKTKRPEAIATLLRGKAIGNQELRDLFTIIPKKMHPVIQRQLLLDTMRQSTNTISKLFNERRFADAIGNLGDERGGIIFGKNWSQVKELTSLLEKINGPTGMGGGSGAALQNIGAIKDILNAAMLAPLAVAAGGHIEAGGFTILGEVVAFKTMAHLLTNPDLTAKLIKALQVTMRGLPYVGTGAVAASGGASKNKTRVTDLIKEMQSKKPTEPGSPPAATPAASTEEDEGQTGPQSMARPTHIFDENKGMIVRA